MMVYVAVSLAIAVLATVFALQNSGQVTVTFMAWKFEGSLAIVLLAALSAGAAVGFLATYPAVLKKKWLLLSQKRKIEKNNRETEEEPQESEQS